MKRMFLALCALWFVSALPAQNRIIVSKKAYDLVVVNAQSDTLCRFSCALGQNYGNKQKAGDHRTPEGTFRIVSIENSKSWTHDFHDGAGQRPGAYGPWFIRLRTPGFSGIGIHGTCFPESIGTRSTEGCIRLNNADLVKLVDYVQPGCEVVILSDN